MHIQLKDHTGKVHRVPAEGAIFGRDRARCDVVLPDIGVSGVHAKIYCRQGRWFLEDLHSSNGTFVGEQRVNGPVELERGVAFGLFRWRFEVVEIANTAAPEASQKTVSDPGKTAALQVALPSSSTGESPAVRGGVSSTAAAGDDDHDDENGDDEDVSDVRTQQVARPSNRAAAAAPPSSLANTGENAIGGTNAAETTPPTFREALGQFTVQRLLGGFKEALAYYLVAIPKLAFKPFAFVRESIADQQQSEMMAVDIAAWAFPPFLIGSLVTLIASIVVAALAGHFAVGQVVVGPIVSVAIAAVASVIAGLLWHPVLGWLVAKLGGRSDAVSRSNMFVVLYTAVPLQSIAAAIGMLLALIPLFFMSLVPPLLGIFATLVLFLALVRWYQHFEVARWFVILLVVLGALAVVSNARVFVYSAQGAVARLRSHSTGAATAAVTVAPSHTGSASAVAGATADTEGAAASPPARMALAEPARPAPSAIPSPAGSSPSVAPAPVAPPPPPVTAPIAKPSASLINPAPVTGTAAPSPAGPFLTYTQFLAERDALEKAIEADPPLLTRSSGALDLYRKLHSEAARVDSKYYPRGKKAADDVVAQRLHDAELYDATVGIVTDLQRLVRTGAH